jgi:DNA-binding transcriptional regulator YiaG
MDKELFDQLLTSIREAGAISRGEMEPSRRFAFAEGVAHRCNFDEQDVKGIREKLQLSQNEFAGLLRVNVRTLQNWEQRRRRPTGPAAALLKIVATAPEAALQALHAG